MKNISWLVFFRDFLIVLLIAIILTVLFYRPVIAVLSIFGVTGFWAVFPFVFAACIALWLVIIWGYGFWSRWLK